MKPLYLDHAATTPVRKEVVKVMNEFFVSKYGNAGSLHALGDASEKALENARKKFAGELGCKTEEIYFTSGASESNNTALKCLAGKKRKVIISTIEHPSVEESAGYLEDNGWDVVRIRVDKNGLLDLEELEKEIDNETALVSVIHASNVFGTIQDLRAIAGICKKHKVLFHTDATQSFGKLPINVRDLGIDMLSASAHKIGGPKGVGLLFVRRGVALHPMIHGGGQEFGLRSGTENVPGIVGFAKALEWQKKVHGDKIRKLRDSMISELEKIGGKLVGDRERRMYHNVNVAFAGANNETLVYRLSGKGIYISAGSACDSKKEKEDYVLKALGLSKKEREGSIRISLGEDFKEKDIGRVVGEIKKIVKRMKIL